MLWFTSLLAVSTVSASEQPHGIEGAALLQSKLVYVDNHVLVTNQSSLENYGEQAEGKIGSEEKHNPKKKGKNSQKKKLKRKRKIRRLIRHLDNDKSGCLSPAELMAALTDDVNRAHVEDALVLVMAGKVTWQEFQLARSAVGGDFAHVVLGIFDEIDRDTNMCLCQKELRKVGGKRQKAIQCLFDDLPPSCKSREDMCLHPPAQCQQDCPCPKPDVCGQVRLMLIEVLIIHLDTDNSGCLCVADLIAALTNDHHRALVEGALDMLTAGEVKWDDLQNARTAVGHAFGHVVKVIFNMVDSNMDTCLSVDEVAVIDSKAVVRLFEPETMALLSLAPGM